MGWRSLKYEEKRVGIEKDEGGSVKWQQMVLF